MKLRGTKSEVASYLAVMGNYRSLRLLPTGEWSGVLDFFVTAGLCVGLDINGYDRRYCYEHRHEAEAALAQWDGSGDPPGPWLKEKAPGRADRLGPGLVAKEWDV